MKKLLLGMLVATISTTTFAFNITNGKFLSHRDYPVNGAVGYFKDLPVLPITDSLPKLAQMTKQFIPTDSYPSPKETIISEAKVFADNGSTNYDLTFEGNLNVMVANHATHHQAYTLYSGLCSDVLNKCVVSEDSFDLGVDGVAQFVRQPSLTLYYNEPTLDDIVLVTAVVRANDIANAKIYVNSFRHQVSISASKDLK